VNYENRMRINKEEKHKMKKIIIIGGGIAGLSAGIYAQKYGFESIIYEKHNIVGGQCTGWDREGYHIDNCIHWLTGSSKGTDLNDAWREVGALGDDINLIQIPYFGKFEFDNLTITLWKNYDKLRAELKGISPEDGTLIDELINDIKVAGKMDMPAKAPFDMMSAIEILKLGIKCKDAGLVMKKYASVSCEEYGNKYHHPALKKLFKYAMPDGYSIAAFLFSMATVCCGDGAIPEGGSRKMALRMAEKYNSLGGRIVTKMGVDEIVIANQGTSKARAIGVKLSDQTTVLADYVIAAADVYYTFEKLLKGQYHDEQFTMRFNDTKNYPLPTSAHAAFAVDADLKEYPMTLTFETTPYTVGEATYDLLSIRNYAYEPEFAPKGKSVITTFINQNDADYLWWEKCYQNEEAYKAEKERIGKLCEERIVKRFPELDGKLRMIDSFTPMTYKRFCSAYHGAWMSFLMTPGAKMLNHKGIIRGLKNCYLAGMYMQAPGGLPIALVTGKFAVQRICRQEKIKI